MSDQERKGKSIKADEDSKETSKHEAEEEEREGDDEGDAEGADESDGHDGSDKSEEQDDEEPSDEDAARAQRVASALGVGDPAAEAGTEEEPEEPPAPQNRAARRAEASQRRKKRKTEGGAEAAQKSVDDEEPDAPLPRDKNARAKELLKRRREAAAGDAGPRPVQLLPGEMVDDALARGSSAASKWIRENFGIIQWVILGALAVGGGYLFYESRVDKSSASASSALMAGVNADRGRVLAEDKRTDEEKEADPLKVYKTVDERADTALAAYQRVQKEHAGSGAAILARLGEAGDYLDKKEYDKAIEAFSAVSSSTLAGADPDVKGRALEGLAFAKEGKGDLDGALASFKDVEAVDGRGYKELGLYHQGRIWLAKGDKDKAKDFLKQAHDKLEQPTSEGQAFRYLQQMTDETLRRIDPSLVPAKAPAIGGPKGGAMTADEIEKIKRQLQDAMRQQQKKGDQH